MNTYFVCCKISNIIRLFAKNNWFFIQYDAQKVKKT